MEEKNHTVGFSFAGTIAAVAAIWRFPYLLYEYKGAFLWMFIFFSIIVGIPLIVRAPLRQHFADTKILTTTIAAVILSYFAAVGAWVINFLGASPSLRFAESPELFFFVGVLGKTDNSSWFGIPAWTILVGLAIVWILTFKLARVKTVFLDTFSRWTHTALITTLALLALFTATIPGAWQGIAMMFSFSSWSDFFNPSLLVAALSQTLLVLFVIIFAAKTSDNANRTKQTLWLATMNVFASIAIGTIVLSALGALAAQQGVPANALIVDPLSITFTMLPRVIASLPYYPALFATLIFGIIAASIIAEFARILIGLTADIRHIKTSLQKPLVFATLAGAVLGAPYIFGGGAYLLDIVDRFVVGYGLPVAMLAVIFTSLNIIRKGRYGKLLFAATYILFLGIVALIAWGITTDILTPYHNYPATVLAGAGIIPFAAILILAFMVVKSSRHTANACQSESVL